jgi:hypothetical protein
MSSKHVQVNFGHAELSNLKAGISVSCTASASLQLGNHRLRLRSDINADEFPSVEVWLRAAEPTRFSLELEDHSHLVQNASPDISLQQSLVRILQSPTVSAQAFVENTLIWIVLGSIQPVCPGGSREYGHRSLSSPTLLL